LYYILYCDWSIRLLLYVYAMSFNNHSTDAPLQSSML